MAALTYVELFAGAGGLSLGLEAAGFHPIAHCEIEPHARAVLRYRWPDVRLDGDVTQVNGADFCGVTLISGGSPCQDLSVAGKRKGLAGERSGLFHQQVRIWQESQAPYLLWENVLGALSSNAGRDFAAVLSALVGTALPVPADGWRAGGVAAGPDAVAAWRVLDLQHFGPPQRRVRVFVLAARAGGVDPAEVLALSEGLCRHPSPRHQQRQGVASRTGAGASSRLTWDNALNAGDVQGPLMALTKSGGDRNGVLAYNSYQRTVEHVVSGVMVNSHATAGVLAFNWQNGGGYGEANIGLGITEEGTGPLSKSQVMAVTQPTVMAFAQNQRGELRTSEVAAQLTTGGEKPGEGYAAVICTTGEVTHALTTQPGATDDGMGRGTPIVLNTIPSSYAKGPGHNKDDLLVIGTLDVHDSTKWGSHQWVAQDKAMVSAGRPRRLTPLECERLMSWPDQWTATGCKEDGTEYALSDTARYRLCGNGVGSVCVAWFAQRLAAML